MSAYHIKDKKVEEKSVFSKASKVTKEQSWMSKRMLPFLMGGVGLVLIGIIFREHHKEVKKQEETKQHKIEIASSLLKKRLEALKDIPLQASLSAVQPKIENVNNTSAYSKEIVARMNAPTSLYEGGRNASFSQADGIAANYAKPSVDGAVPEATFIGKGADQTFGNTTYQTTSVDAKQVPHPEYTIVSGEMLHAVLNVAMNSDLPGMVTATVTSPAYAYTQNRELIPKGSRLIGQYSSAVLQGQSRVFIMWNRLVLPDGVSVDINSPDTDQIGQSGEPADYINRHFWSRFGEAVLLSILGAGVANVDVQSSDQYNSAQAYRMAIADSLQQSASGTLEQTISLKPTLVRYQGANINVFIAHDLSFYNLYQQQGKVLA